MSEGLTDVAVVVLAAGKGTRMKSRRVKVLHEICGVPMLGHIKGVAEGIGASRLVVVVGRDAEDVKRAYGGSAEFVLQAEQNGTGHAVTMAEPKLGDFAGDIFILYGDTPLLTVATLERMRQLKADSGADLVMLTASGDIPGRVVRNAEGGVVRIVEAQDATPAELAIEERNTGVYLVDSQLLWAGLASIDSDNEQGELYVTDVVGYAVREGHAVEALWLEDADECLGINNRSELAAAGRIMRRRIIEGLMAEGVSIVDPETTYIDASVSIGRDTLIEPGCTITGDTVIGEGVHLKAGCYIESSRLDDDVVFGPMSHLRPNCHLMTGVRIGNFVEVKNTRMGPGSKAAHLTYLGDADIGADVNFGCGSVIVNYDGYEKHRSTVGDGAFVGCNVNLISPVEIEERAFLAAGSTISLDVPEDALAVARARQRNLEGWRARKEGRAAKSPAASQAGAAKKTGAKTKKKAAPKTKGKKKVSTKKKAAARKKTAKRKATAKKAPSRAKAAKAKAVRGGTKKGAGARKTTARRRSTRRS